MKEDNMEEQKEKDLTTKQCWIIGLVVAIIVTGFVTMLSSFGVGILIGIPVGIAVACGASGISAKARK